jgi:hypothetical protein
MPIPDGPQFIDVYHASMDNNAPHVRYGHPHVFAGTEQAAIDRMMESGRDVIHHYRIPVSMLRPEIWADDDHDPDSERDSRIVMELADKSGPTLWETVPVRPRDVKPGEVLQYRNQVEDKGSISYIMHKKDINDNKIKYMGMSLS